MAKDIKVQLANALAERKIDYDRVIESLLISGNKITCILKLDTVDEGLKAAVEQILRQIAPYMETSVMQSQPQPKAPAAQKPQAAEGVHPDAGIDRIKHIVAVASGKGGVGKSTVSVNLAIALSRMGKKVGLLDADIYGPSIPIMLDSLQRPSSPDGKTIIPVEAHGLKTLSIGYMLENQDAVVWRGPMLHSALQQMLLQVMWQELDVLVIDMPPGTGDVAITISQKARLDGAVIVTTPQNVALADAKKAIGMFGKVNVPVLGLIENMSYFACPHCGEQTAIFGQEGGKNYAHANDIPLLGQLPLKAEASDIADRGIPLAGTDGLFEAEFTSIAEALWDRF